LIHHFFNDRTSPSRILRELPNRVWPVGWEPLNALPAEAALRFPEPPSLDPAAGEAPRPSFPAWLPDLAAALRSGADPAALPMPGAEAWLADVRRAEDYGGKGRV
jgi:hypothetical protein